MTMGSFVTGNMDYIRRCVYRKPKSGCSGDEARQGSVAS